MPTPDTILANVKAEMARRRVTQSDVADALGITAAGVSARFHGRTPLRVEELITIADLLKVNVAFLVTEPATAAAV